EPVVRGQRHRSDRVLQCTVAARRGSHVSVLYAGPARFSSRSDERAPLRVNGTCNLQLALLIRKAAGANPQYFAINLTKARRPSHPESCGCQPAVLCYQPNKGAPPFSSGKLRVPTRSTLLST